MTARENRSGFTLLEVVLSATILLVMVWIVTTLSISGSDAQKFAERLTRSTEIAQDLTDDMRRELVSSVRLFHDDAVGQSYLNVVDTKSTKTPIASRLPTLDPGGIFEKDGVSEKTGNILLFARHAWSTPFQTSTGNTYRVDVYRLVGYYLAAEGDGPEPGSEIGLNLVKWVSEPLADGDQIDNIADPLERAEVLGHLVNRTPDALGRVHPRCEVAWLRGRDASLSGTLRHIQPTGTMTDSPQAPRPSPWRIYADPEHTVDGHLHYRHHSVVTNYARASLGVALFAKRSDAGDGFPHGFEVQVIGPASARQVLIRLLVTSTNNKGHRAHAVSQVIIDSRDL